ncbi:MAG: hypothetical protein M3Z18_03725 [Gemmatimonadota bacterium]|nr:hypothetical protein [Gemmatimonadota bacterium]
MQIRSSRFATLAAVMMLASACSGDNPNAPSVVDGSNSASVPLSSAIKSDIAATAGNAIASDLESMIANQVSAVGSFALLARSTPMAGFSDGTPAPLPSPTAPADQPNCTAGSQPGVFLCAKLPGPGDHLQCTYSEEKKLYICVKEKEPAPPKPPSTEAKPAPAPAPAVPDKPESCSFNAAGLIYSCAKSGDGKSVVKSYQFLDASGTPMEKFIKGTTEAIHYLMKTDAVESRDNNRSVTHSFRDATLSGFLGPNRIWNGFGSSADTTVHKEDLSTRTYTGLSVDTVKAVTFVDERASHPYPLSGSFVRVVDYKVVSTGKQLETTTVHKRAVVTFNGTADVPISLGDYSCILHLNTHKVDGCK